MLSGAFLKLISSLNFAIWSEFGGVLFVVLSTLRISRIETAALFVLRVCLQEGEQSIKK